LSDCVSYEISRHYKSWLAKANGLTHDRSRASDLVHEVIVCGGKVRQYVDRALWLSWHSNRSDYATRYRKYYELITDKAVDDAKQDETWLGHFIDGEYLYSAIGRLNEHDAILLRLYSKPDFDYKKLSEETGIPNAYLRLSIHRAIKRIREYVQLQRASSHPTGEA
jgi:DNA-directed RNA polymerase specialized sigma24 family protein